MCWATPCAGAAVQRARRRARGHQFNPYWRVAYAHDWGVNSIMVGTYGMVANVYPDNLNTTTPTDRYSDVAVDAQYQYITDVHTVTAQTTYIWEKQSYNASYPITQETGTGYGAGPTPANPTDPLRTFKLKGSYYYERKYGATLAYFQTTGSADEGLYGTTRTATPTRPTATATSSSSTTCRSRTSACCCNTRVRQVRRRENNYDGTGRNASDNNTLFFDVWVASEPSANESRHRASRRLAAHAKGSEAMSISRGRLAMVLAGAATVASAQSAAPPTHATNPGEERAVNLCSTCHGPRGISTSPEFPISPRSARAISSRSSRISSTRRARKRRRTISCGASRETSTPR